MPSQDDPIQIYKALADLYDRRGEASMRDRFLVLAADSALRSNRTEDSDRIRIRLLKLNPHHMLKPYASFTQAMQAPDVQTYARDLRLNYPPEVALVLLNSLHTSSTKLNETADLPHLPADDDATVELGQPTEALKVYSDQRAADSPQTAALPRHLLEDSKRPVPPAKMPLPAPRVAGSSANVPRPQPVPMKSGNVPRPQPPATESLYLPVSDPEAETHGGWFAVLLSVLVILTGLVLAGYLMARPFLS